VTPTPSSPVTGGASTSPTDSPSDSPAIGSTNTGTTSNGPADNGATST
jgi:hypothetical protein